MGSHTFDSYNAMIYLFGPPPLLVNGTILTLEHVMQRLEIVENKVATIDLIENLDRKIQNQITQYGSKVGVALKFFKEKEPMCRGIVMALLFQYSSVILLISQSTTAK